MTPIFKRWRRSITVCTVYCMVLGFSATASAAKYGLPDFRDLVQANTPAVVNISTRQSNAPRNNHTQPDIPDLPDDSPFKDFMDKFFEEMPEGRNTRSSGSGFIISNDGYILTNAHVVDEADKVIVSLTDGRELTAKVIGSDRRSDVALIKVKGENLQPVNIGDDDKLEVGEWVLAIGSPFGFESSATAGIVSAKGRSLPNENYIPFIQTDVAINPGNSGGPLFNLDGDVIGINAQIYSRTGGFMGLSFAVPISMAMSVADQLKTKGKVSRGWLGVAIQTVTQELSESLGMDRPSGALITEILADSPAASSELRTGDVIVKFNGQAIRKMSDLPPVVGTTLAGETAKVRIVRDGIKQTLMVKIGELPVEEVAVDVPAPEDNAQGDTLGLELAELDKQESESLGIDSGVVVKGVTEGPASRAGIREGDIILQIDSQEIATVDDVDMILAQLDKNESTPVLIRRGERSLFLALKQSPQ